VKACRYQDAQDVTKPQLDVEKVVVKYAFERVKEDAEKK
jgi:hypothetical protein